MARTTQPTIAQAIAEHRRAAGLSFYALAVELVPLLPRQFRPSPEKLRRMEAGLVDESEMDPCDLPRSTSNRRAFTGPGYLAPAGP